MKNALDKNLLLSFRLLYYLEENRGRRLKLDEILEELDIDESKGKRLINTLKKSPQIEIDSKIGRAGGYELKLNTLSHVFLLNELEVKSIDLANNLLKREKGFYLRNHFKNAISKIKSNIKEVVDNIKLERISKKQVSISYDEEDFKIIELIEDAKNRKIKLELNYFSIESKKISKRIVHPYQIFYYEESKDYYLIAYCENRKDIRQFKFKRIKEINVLSDNFVINNFDFDEYIKDHVGIHRGEEFDLEVILFYPYNIFIKETPVLDNQKIIDINENKSILKAKIKGGDEIISWLLGMGKGAEVIKPNKLRENIIKALEDNLSNYRSGVH